MFKFQLYCQPAGQIHYLCQFASYFHLLNIDYIPLWLLMPWDRQSWSNEVSLPSFLPSSASNYVDAVLCTCYFT